MKREPRAKYLIDQMRGHAMVIQGVLGSLSFYTESKWKRVVDVPRELREMHESLTKLSAKLQELESVPVEAWRKK